jgi:hypothetical protein
VKQEALDGALSEESLAWLVETFPHEFAPSDESQGAAQTPTAPGASPDDRRQMVAEIDKQLRRLASVQAKVAAIEERNIETKLLAAALPAPAAMDKLIRYETANDRALDRALHRLAGAASTGGRRPNGDVTRRLPSSAPRGGHTDPARRGAEGCR